VRAIPPGSPRVSAGGDEQISRWFLDAMDKVSTGWG